MRISGAPTCRGQRSGEAGSRNVDFSAALLARIIHGECGGAAAPHSGNAPAAHSARKLPRSRCARLPGQGCRSAAQPRTGMNNPRDCGADLGRVSAAALAPQAALRSPDQSGPTLPEARYPIAPQPRFRSPCAAVSAAPGDAASAASHIGARAPEMRHGRIKRGSCSSHPDDALRSMNNPGLEMRRGPRHSPAPRLRCNRA